MQSCVLAIDQGTTGTTCLVVEYAGTRVQILGRGHVELPQHFPQPGWVEHDLFEIENSVHVAARAALAQSGVSAKCIVAIGIANQRETTCLWDEDGAPAARAIVWQDRRTTSLCAALRDAGWEAYVKEHTGLIIDPYFSATKLGWLLQSDATKRARAAAGTLRFGTVNSFLLQRMCGPQVHITDACNASRTMLFDIYAQRWDPALCQACGALPASLLPAVVDNSGVFGTTRNVGFVPDGVPICGMTGDQQAALLGQGCTQVGMAKCTFGTGAFALVNTGAKCRPSRAGLICTVAYRIGGEVTYAVEGSVFVAGAVVQWLRDGLRMFDSSAEVEALAAQAQDCGGVVLVPALSGLGAPYWRPEARGLIAGITRGTTRAHIARAALEGIAFQVYDLLAAMRADSGAPLAALRVDGGAAANNLLMQFQADLLGIAVRRPQMIETTGLGAAHLAAVGAGLYDSLEELSHGWEQAQCFEPKQSSHAVAQHLQRWHLAVARA